MGVRVPSLLPFDNKKNMKPLRFLQEVRREGGKVTWPSSRETLTGSIMVVIMVAIASIFFLIIDQIFSFGLDKVIGIGI